MKYSKDMYNEDFIDWMREMPVGYLQYLWKIYKLSYSDDSDMPPLGDNFTVIAKIEAVETDPIKKFEDDLMADRITLQDLIRREE